MIDFHWNKCNSIKSIILKGNATIDVTSRFIERKMLIFAKFLLKSFLYVLIDVFCFPSEEVRRIYDQYYIIKCHLYLNLTSTDSCLMFFNFIYKDICNVKESESRKIVFEILKQLRISKRLDLSKVVAAV